MFIQEVVDEYRKFSRLIEGHFGEKKTQEVQTLRASVRIGTEDLALDTRRVPLR